MFLKQDRELIFAERKGAKTKNLSQKKSCHEHQNQFRIEIDELRTRRYKAHFTLRDLCERLTIEEFCQRSADTSLQISI